jgi:hypothetical protein
MSGFSFIFFILFVGFYIWRVAEFGLEVKKLWEMHEFYTELLEVPEVRTLALGFLRRANYLLTGQPVDD